MDKVNAAFEVLIGLAAVDGDIDDREIEVISNFLQANYGQINFDPNAVVNTLQALTGEGLVEEIGHAAGVIKQTCSAAERTAVLDFGLQLIAADGVLDENEKRLFGLLAHAWGIDLQAYLQQRLGG